MASHHPIHLNLYIKERPPAFPTGTLRPPPGPSVGGEKLIADYNNLTKVTTIAAWATSMPATHLMIFAVTPAFQYSKPFVKVLPGDKAFFNQFGNDFSLFGGLLFGKTNSF
jgi:hypothetical protein